jgi:hypothetical protein
MNMDKDKKKKKGFFSKAKEEIGAGLAQVVDDIHYIAGTKRGKEIEKSLDEKYPYRTKGYKNGGMAGKKEKMHRMPDGTMMKDSAHKGQSPKKMSMGGAVTGTTRGVGKARKQTYRIC